MVGDKEGRKKMADLVNLEKLSEKVRDVVTPYCQQMLRLHQENINSIFIYGSATGEDFVYKKSNINILFIFKKLGFSVLKKSLNIVNSGRKKGIVAPLMFTMEYVHSSTDVFPIEFLEIKENYLLLYGEDVLASLEIHPHNIRLQCEQQIKGGLIRLYESYLEMGMKEKEIGSLMVTSLTSFIPVFRNLLRLKGKVPSVKKKITLEEMCKEFSLSNDLFWQIMDIKEGKKIKSIESLFEKYLKEIERLEIAVDKMQV